MYKIWLRRRPSAASRTPISSWVLVIIHQPCTPTKAQLALDYFHTLHKMGLKVHNKAITRVSIQVTEEIWMIISNRWN